MSIDAIITRNVARLCAELERVTTITPELRGELIEEVRRIVQYRQERADRFQELAREQALAVQLTEWFEGGTE